MVNYHIVCWLLLASSLAWRTWEIDAFMASILSPCRSLDSINRRKNRLETRRAWTTHISASRGFGSSAGEEGGRSTRTSNSSNKKKSKKFKSRLIDTLTEKQDDNRAETNNRPYVKSEQEVLLSSLAKVASTSCIGRAVASSPLTGTTDMDPFWQLIPSLICSRFPQFPDHALERVAGFVRHRLDPNLPLEDDIIQNPYRPEKDIHAYMPGLGPTQPFYDPNQLDLCRQLSANYETIRTEYDALVADMQRDNGGMDRFQSVTSMNYESGWQTVVLFYNGHRISGFPYHLCPTTTRILESVPLAGRIAGFNRQQPQSGIPQHTDGNNMWLTCQMGIYIPENDAAYIRVGPETRYWTSGDCLLYDTTYEHETMNAHPKQERVVLHVDFFNTLAMTPIEIEVMQYIYSLREEFMKAEGVAKVGAQIL